MLCTKMLQKLFRSTCVRSKKAICWRDINAFAKQPKGYASIQFYWAKNHETKLYSLTLSLCVLTLCNSDDVKCKQNETSVIRTEYDSVKRSDCYFTEKTMRMKLTILKRSECVDDGMLITYH